MKKMIVVAMVLVLAGCTDAERSKFGAYGSEAVITCYSGNAVIFDDESTGKVLEADGNGIAFRSKSSGKYVRAYADCIVTEK